MRNARLLAPIPGIFPAGDGMSGEGRPKAWPEALKGAELGGLS